MKKFSILMGFVLSTFAASVWADTSVICDHSLKATSPLFQNAYNNVYSFQYVHHALESVLAEAGPQEVLFCTSSVALNKNIYQYLEHLIQIDAYVGKAAQPKYTFRLLFQNASIQAFHNVGGQPWVGLSASETQQKLDALVKQASFKSMPVSAKVTNALDIAVLSPSFQKDQGTVEPNSLSAIPVSVSSGKNIFLVSWMTKNSNDPFASPVFCKGLLIAIDKDRHFEIAENLYLQEDLLFPLEEQLERQQSKLGAAAEWMQKLLDLSRP